MTPKLAVCNIIHEADRLHHFAQVHGFTGIEWSFDLDSLPRSPSEESRWADQIEALRPLEVRFHCPFYHIDLGHDDPKEAKAAQALFRRIIYLVSKVGGRYLSIHIGLGRDSTEPLSWDQTIDNLGGLVQYGLNHRVQVCLENLAWGWTSKPNLFEKLIRKTGAGVTFDIGHAVVCESVESQQYRVEDFVFPHPERIFNAHVYHREEESGHTSPRTVHDVASRLALLQKLGCSWWVLEVREIHALLQTKGIVEEYLDRLGPAASTQEG
jgi:sugar phosphate isomerase/epimerase